MKINFISINSKFIHSSLAAAGISRMYSVYSKKLGISLPELSVTETTVNDSFDSIINSVMNGADVFAFSVYIWNINTVERVCRYLKKAKPDSIIILGGPEISYGTEIPGFCYDYLISGEGERAFFALVCELCGESVPAEWRYAAKGKIRFADNISDLSELEFPYGENNINSFCDRIIYYESSRGCPFSCAYCLSSVCGKVRELPLERVFSDLQFFIDHKIPQVKFVDRTFNCNRKRAQAIWRFIIESECETNFHFEIGADLLNETDIEILSSCPEGRIQLEAGIQSTHAPALDECCRHTDTERLFSNVNALVRNGNINIHVDLIAGLPYETADIFQQSFNDAYSLHAHQLQLGFLKLLHGAPLNEMLEKHGYVFSEDSPYEVISNKYLSFNEVLELKRIEDVLERFYNSNRFRRTLIEAENLFNSPYEMYSAFAESFRNQGMTHRPVSTKLLYNFLSEFFKRMGADFDKMLLLDFYCSEKSDVVPSELRYLAGSKGNYTEILRGSSMSKNKKAQVKIIENTAYIIDYSNRSPVDGNFRIGEVIENVHL